MKVAHASVDHDGILGLRRGIGDLRIGLGGFAHLNKIFGARTIIGRQPRGFLDGRAAKIQLRNLPLHGRVKRFDPPGVRAGNDCRRVVVRGEEGQLDEGAS